MTGLLILTTPGDYHAHAVRWCAAQYGARADLWIPGDLPDYSRATIRLEHQAGDLVVEATYADTTLRLDRYPVVWNRRRSTPTPPEGSSPHDAVPIEMSCVEHIRNIVALLSERSFVVNDDAAQHRASRKSIQLVRAAEVGLAIPDTIISNDPVAIAAFLERHGVSVGKSYYPFSWLSEEGKIHSSFTFQMDGVDEAAAASITLSPIIVQRKVVRRAEVRIVAFGNELIAVQVAGEARGSVIDARLQSWRDPTGFSRAELPPSVRAACLAYMSALGLRYGAFDFVIDQDGTWFFLECNEAGQFLFLEKYVPGTGILDAFTRFLIGGATGPTTPSKRPCTLAQFERSDAFHGIEASLAGHKPRSTKHQFAEESGG